VRPVAAPQTVSLWRLSNGAEQAEVNVGGRFGVNNISMMRCMAGRGHGIALLPHSLCQVLPDWYIGPTAIFAVTPSRHVTASLRSLLDFLEARLRLS
jgi:DNA-binding transcriptional LysR family regulator